MILRPALILVAVGLLLMAGCSRFNREWKQAAKAPTSTNDIAGRWEGRWISDANGHNDVLRCIITRVDDQSYDANFRAAYKKWITVHFGYTVRLQGTNTANEFKFRGSEDLGVLAGGVYIYEGRANATNFFSTYKSKYDWGTFQMKRPVE